MKFFRKCPLFVLLVLGAMAFSVIGYVNRDGIYQIYQEQTAHKPVLASVFLGIKDGIYPWDTEAVESWAPGEDGGPDAGQTEGAQDAGNAGQSQEDASGHTEKDNVISENEISGNEISGNAASGNGSPGEGISGNGAGDSSLSENDISNSGSGAAGDKTEVPEEKQTYEFVPVEEDYFADALFIGDSRTQGLYEYSGLADTATFYCKTSLTVYDLFQKEKAFITENGEKLTLRQALTRHQFKKIYLMIGINEMGTGTPESFFEEYARTVYEIKRLQPDAIIFLQGIMRVAEKKNASDPIFNNTNINIRNVMIETLADNSSVFYLEVNDVVCDENGNLYSDWTFDQIHLKGKYYQVWKDYLMAHGIVK